MAYVHDWLQHIFSQWLHKEHASSFLKLNIEFPYDLAIPLLDTYPEKMKTLMRKDTYTPIFIAALFRIAKTWKQPNVPSIDD